MLGNQFGVREDFPHFLSIVVQTGLVWSDTRHDRGPGWVASRCRAVCVGEQHTARCKTINVGSQCLGVSLQATDPVVEVIDRNEKYVWFRSASRSLVRGLVAIIDGNRRGCEYERDEN